LAFTTVLQEWITVYGDPGQVVVQDTSEWLVMPEAQDIAFYTFVTSVTALSGSGETIRLSIQTSPTPDAEFFDAHQLDVTPAYIATYVLSNASTLGVQPVTVVRWSDTGVQPPGKYYRWRLDFQVTATRRITFRSDLSVNPAGWMGSVDDPRAEPVVRPPRASTRTIVARRGGFAIAAERPRFMYLLDDDDRVAIYPEIDPAEFGRLAKDLEGRLLDPRCPLSRADRSAMLEVIELSGALAPWPANDEGQVP
jgi:hypothetical protein